MQEVMLVVMLVEETLVVVTVLEETKLRQHKHALLKIDSILGGREGFIQPLEVARPSLTFFCEDDTRC